MKHATATRIVLALVLIVGIIGFSAFGQKEGNSKNSFRKDSKTRYEDTATRRHSTGTVDDKDIERKLDAAMRQLDVEMQKLDEKMKKMDFSKMNKEIEESMKKVDFEKIGKQVEAEMKKVDWNKLEKDTDAAFSKIDQQKLKEEIHVSMAKLQEVEMPKIREQLKKVQLELEKNKEHMKIDHEQINRDVQRSLEKARASIANAQDEIMSMKAFIDVLQKDRLIDKEKGYKIQVKEGELYLNGKKQTQEIRDKYKQYFKKKNFEISNRNEDDRI
jgi:hypothetical protein